MLAKKDIKKIEMAMKKENRSPLFEFEYDEAPESTKIVNIEAKSNLFINGKFPKPSGGKYFPTINPATGDVLSEVAEAGVKDIDLAVSSAGDSCAKSPSLRNNTSKPLPVKSGSLSLFLAIIFS